MNAEEKKQQAKAWNERNQHVLDMNGYAEDIIRSMLAEGKPKEDVCLLGNLIIDLCKRFD